MPNFWWHSLKLSYWVSKNPFRMFIWGLKSIEFHLKHYKIPKLSLYWFRLISQGLADFDTDEELPDKIIVSDVGSRSSLRSKLHYCFYCDQGQTAIIRHLKLVHNAENEVINAHNENDTVDEGQKLALIKFKGNYFSSNLWQGFEIPLPSIYKANFMIQLIFKVASAILQPSRKSF